MEATTATTHPTCHKAIVTTKWYIMASITLSSYNTTTTSNNNININNYYNNNYISKGFRATKI
jgi:hypothetical protein